MKNEMLARVFVDGQKTVKESMRRMSEAGQKILLVVNDDKVLLGTVSDGDIRRWILAEGDLNESVDKIMNRNPMILDENYDANACKKIMMEKKIEWIPIVDDNKKIVSLALWSDLFDEVPNQHSKDLEKIPVVIMAGGKGERLDPFTKILPKPLIPIGEKPIIELIMEKFKEYGCNDFYMTVNYKGKMIQSYIDCSETSLKVNLVWEDIPLGTAGSLALLPDEVKKNDIFVSNCDILINADYSDIYNAHVCNGNDITIIASLQHVSVPYGVIEMKNGGVLSGIVEKPEYDFFVNTGMYIVKKNLIDNIQRGTKLNFTEFINDVKRMGGNIGVYPIAKDAWHDVGQWHEYQRSLKKINKSAQ